MELEIKATVLVSIYR